MTKSMRKVRTYAWDPARHIETEKDVVAYLDAALEEGDPAIIAEVLGDIARSRGMARIAKKAGMGRESLYKSLSKAGNPGLATLVKVLNALGYRLSVKALAA